MPKISKWLNSFYLIFFITAPLSAASYHASTTGNDSQIGTVGQPFRTIAKCVSLLTPGDTCYVFPGTYIEDLPDRIPSGSAGLPVTLRAYDLNNRPVLQPSGPVDVIRFQTTGSNPRHHIAIKGLILDGRNALHNVLRFQDGGTNVFAHHITVEDTEVRLARNQGVLGECNDCVFRNMEVHDNGYTVREHGFYLAGSDGSQHYHINNVVIENCRIYRNAGRGIQNAYHTNLIIRNNVIFGNSLGMDDYGGGRGAICLTGHLIGNLVYNNLIYDNVGDIILGESVKFLNNTVALNQGAGVRLQGDGAEVANNIFYKNTGYGVYSLANTPVIRNNISTGNTSSNYYTPKTDASSGTWTNNLQSDPGLSNPQTYDFGLLSTSPAINTGVTLPQVTNDFTGTTSRPQSTAYDRGAYEFSGQPGPPPAINEPPRSNAGPDRWATIDLPLAITGSAPDDGLPSPPGAVTLGWNKVRGPGSLAFSPANALTTNVSFSSAGAYVIELLADDGGSVSRDDMTVFVHPVFALAGPIVLEAENMSLPYGATVRSGGFASGGKYMEKSSGSTLFPGTAWNYSLEAKYFDPVDSATLRVKISRGKSTIFDTTWTLSQDLGPLPSDTTSVTKLLSANLPLQPDDFISFESGNAWGNDGAFLDAIILKPIGTPLSPPTGLRVE